jgi:transposase
MSDHSEAFVAFDSSKLRNAVAIADSGRMGEIRFLGEIENSTTATAKLVRKLAGKYERLTFCYEAGPTGYELYRQVKSLGHECIVVAPSLIPKKPGDRVKTNRRDAVSLAKLLRAGELTAVWVPDRHHEAMRDLTRARETAVDDLRSKRQQISAFLLRKGVHYCAGKKTWSQAHLNWLMSQKFEYPEHRLVFEEMMMAMRQAQERLERLDQSDPCCGAGLVTGRFGHCADGYARHRFDFGGNVSGGDRRPLAFSIAVRTDGLSWAGAVRGFDRRLR